MVKGIGADIVDIGRMEKIILRYGDHFLRKVFTEAEIAFCGQKARPAIHFAGRWAAKEAFYKALPQSCQALSSWKCIQIIAAEKSGRPILEICNTLLQHRLSKEAIERIHLTISHEQTFCTAFVMME